MSQKVKKRLFEILELAAAGDLASRIVDIFIITLILLNVIAVTLETVQSLLAQYRRFFDIFRVFSIAVFTVEYLLRLWTCTMNKRFEHPLTGRIRFAVTALALIDLMAILPFYLPMIFPHGLDLRCIRAVRLFRLFQLLKMGRYSESLKTFGGVLRAKKEELLIMIFTVLILLVLASSLMCFAEHEVQPQAFSSIPAAMWWGVVTLTTVGYGDVYPITPAGKFLGGIISVLGIGMLALSTGIVTSGFAEELQRRKKGGRICPHCGRDIDESLEIPTVRG